MRNPALEPYGDDLLAALDATLARITRDMDRINAETWRKAQTDALLRARTGDDDE